MQQVLGLGVIFRANQGFNHSRVKLVLFLLRSELLADFQFRGALVMELVDKSHTDDWTYQMRG